MATQRAHEYSHLAEAEELALASSSDEEVARKAPILKTIYDTIRLRGWKPFTKEESKWLDHHQSYRWFLLAFGVIWFGCGFYGMFDQWLPLNSTPFVTTTGEYFNGAVVVDTTITQVPLFGLGSIAMLVIGLMQIIIGSFGDLFNQIYLRIIWGRENFIWFGPYGTFFALFYVSIGWLAGIRSWTVTMAVALFMFIMAAVTSLNGWWAKLSALGDKARYRHRDPEHKEEGAPVSMIFQHAMATGTHYYALSAIKSICGAGYLSVFLYYFIEQAMSVTLHWATYVTVIIAMVMPVLLGVSELLHTNWVYKAVKKTEAGNLAVLAVDKAKTNVGNKSVSVYVSWMWTDSVIFTICVSLMYIFFELRLWV
jgi:hypothetical protein